MEVWIPAIVAVITSSVLSAVATSWFARRKTQAEAGKLAVEAADSALHMMTTAMSELKGELDRRVAGLSNDVEHLQKANVRLEKENRTLQARVSHLNCMVTDAVNLQRMRAILDASPNGVLLETPDRTIGFVNQAFCDMFHIPVSPDELAGQSCIGAAEKLHSVIGDVKHFEERVDYLISNFKRVVDEPVHLADGTQLLRTFIPIFHGANGTKEVAWVYRSIVV